MSIVIKGLTSRTLIITKGLGAPVVIDLSLPIFTLISRAYKGSAPECVVMNTTNFAITEYMDYGFNSMVRFNGTNLIADQNGIYEQDLSDLDDSRYPIKAHIQSRQVDTYKHFDNIQRLRNAYLCYESDGDLQLITTADETITRKYTLPLQEASRINEKRVKFEKGIKNKVFSFKVQNINGSTMEIVSLRVLLEPITGKRR